MRWVENWLCGSEGCHEWSKTHLEACNGIPKGSPLGLVLFNLSMTWMKGWRFGADMELGQGLIHLKVPLMGAPEERNLMRLNKGKWRVLHWGGRTPRASTSWGDLQLRRT